jgi:hypothetical protein
MSQFKFEPKKVTVMEWKSYFFPEVNYVGYIEDEYSKTGRRLMSLGRTKAEAELLSYNKQGGSGVWRLQEYIKQNA